MYLFFLDESGTPPSPAKAEGKFFVIGGVIIHHEDFQQLFTEFELLRHKHLNEGEIKFSYFDSNNNKKGNNLKHLSNESLNEFRALFFNFINEKPIYSIAQIINCEEAYKAGISHTADDIYHYGYLEILYSFDRFLLRTARGANSKVKSMHEFKNIYGMVFSDHRMSHEDKLLRIFHHEITDRKLPNLLNPRRTNNIIGSINFIESELSPFLQLADITAGSIYQLFQYKRPQFFEKLKPSFIKNPHGKNDGLEDMNRMRLFRIFYEENLSSGEET